MFRGTYKNNRGLPAPVELDCEKWLTFARALQKHGVTLVESDFECVMDQAQQGDFIFIDPPYIGTGTRVYLKFTNNDHLRLMAKIKEVSDRGVHVMMFNHSGLDLSNNPELSTTPVLVKKRAFAKYVEVMYTNYTVVSSGYVDVTPLVSFQCDLRVSQCD